jgi:hypothetical protein
MQAEPTALSIRDRGSREGQLGEAEVMGLSLENGKQHDDS